MEIINNTLMIISHLICISLTHQMLRHLVDWEKWLKNPSDNLGYLKVFLIFLSIAIGYLVSHFILEIISASQAIFFAIQ